MTPQQIAQVAAAMLVVATPWLVVSVAFRVAQALARAVAQTISRPIGAVSLGWLTLGGVIVTGVLGVGVLATPWLQGIAGLEFVALAVLAMNALGEIDRVSKPAREIESAQRSAGLDVRRADQYLPWTWRFASYSVAMAGVVTFALRLSTPTTGRQLFVPVMFAGASLVFVALYEVWIQGIVNGPMLSDGRDQNAMWRRRLIRRIFAMEWVLLTSCLVAAHALLDLNWQANGGFGATVSLSAGVVGIVGCALALSSDFTRRGYTQAPSASLRRTD